MKVSDDSLSGHVSALVLLWFLWGIASAVAAVSGGPTPFTFWFIGLSLAAAQPAAYLVTRWRLLHRRGLVPMVVVGGVAFVVAVAALVVPGWSPASW